MRPAVIVIHDPLDAFEVRAVLHAAEDVDGDVAGVSPGRR